MFRSTRAMRALAKADSRIISEVTSFAALHRLIAKYKLGDMCFTNCSMLHRVRRHFDIEFLRTPLLQPFELITPHDFASISREDDVTTEATSDDVHRSIYDNRAEIRCIVHSYSAPLVAASLLKEPLPPVTRGAQNLSVADNGLLLPDSVFEEDHDSSTSKFSTAVSKALVRPHTAVFVPGRGAIIIARSCAEAFLVLCMLNRHAETVLLLRSVPGADLRDVTGSRSDDWLTEAAQANWPAMVSMVGL
eukprot:TRINITY_DN57255_c0_g1_i1.p1 TRINITY_DN57255_c0_g1~~TRINITY_DN57255_c0_g1_i1.p1  ORF type:complete len:248 (-),score=36.34 TRINITY_DN57255_c0_g1_i1:243-986(-)